MRVLLRTLHPQQWPDRYTDSNRRDSIVREENSLAPDEVLLDLSAIALQF